MSDRCYYFYRPITGRTTMIVLKWGERVELVKYIRKYSEAYQYVKIQWVENSMEGLIKVYITKFWSQTN